MALEYSNIDDFFGLAEIAQDTDSWFVIRGSVARMCAAQHVDPNRPESPPRSLFDLVRPLATVAVICPVESRESLRRAISRALPAAKFFHWEFRSPDELQNGHLNPTNLTIAGEAQIAFLPRKLTKGDLPKLIDPFVSIRLTVKGAMFVRTKRLENPKIDWIGDSHEGFYFPAVLRDLIYLVRLYLHKSRPRTGKVIHELAGVLRRAGGARIARELLADSLELERTKLAVLMYVRSSFSTDYNEPDQLTEILGQENFQTLVDNINDPIFEKLLELARSESRKELRAIIGPGEGAATRRIMSLFTRRNDEELVKKEFVSSDKNLAVALQDGHMSPIFRIQLPRLADERCCKYQDFAHGIIETVWSDSDSASRDTKALLSLVQTDSSQGIQFAHSYVHLGPVSSARTDFAFVKLLSGQSSEANLASVWYDLPLDVL